MGYKKPPAWKKQLEDAKQRNRDLDNTNHDLQVEVLRLSTMAVHWEREAVAFSKDLATARGELSELRASLGHHPLSDIELYALQSLVNAEGRPMSEVRERLIHEMRRRNILPHGYEETMKEDPA